jgi:hypothetical protein
MYFIVETIDQFNQMPIGDECFIQLITGNTKYHPKLTYPSLIYYNDGEKGYIFPFNHSEAFSLDITLVDRFLNKHNKVYLLDKKYHSYFLDTSNAIDVNFIHLDQTNSSELFNCDTLLHSQYYSKYGELDYVNTIIPISKHYESCECLYESVKGYFDLEIDTSFQDRLISSYKLVESKGIKIDTEKFTSKYSTQSKNYSIKEDIIHSYYNLYNLTARPTNAFNSVNFLAIPKDKEYRECFIPANDYMVEFDFDAYHLRLIGKLIDYKWPKESIHNILGREYFNKAELSEEEYKESKTITFKQLYGGVDKKYKHIEFFSKLDKYIETMWDLYKKQKAIFLPTGSLLKYSASMNKLKLFNYIVQNQETLANVDKIERINQYLIHNNCQTALILITYDAFLFDYSIKDGKDTLIQIKTILEADDMVVKHSHSVNYSF